MELLRVFTSKYNIHIAYASHMTVNRLSTCNSCSHKALLSCNNFCHHWLPSYNSFSPLAHLIPTTMTSLWFRGNYNHAHVASLYLYSLCFQRSSFSYWSLWLTTLVHSGVMLLWVFLDYNMSKIAVSFLNHFITNSFYPALKNFISTYFYLIYIMYLSLLSL